MNPEQARRFGDYLRRRRNSYGYSVRRLAAISGINQPTLLRIERGDFLNPGLDKLRAIGSALDLSPTAIWELSGHNLMPELPEPGPFLRAKYQNLPPEQLAALTEDVAHILREHGIDPHGRPQNNEDETDEEPASRP